MADALLSPCLPPAFPPMPMPPAGFAGLTPEELRALEGHERQHLEARLQSLRNIHTLLDAAMLQISQYLTVLASLGYVPGTLGLTHARSCLTQQDLALAQQCGPRQGPDRL